MEIALIAMIRMNVFLADIQSRLVIKGKKIAKERKEAKMRDAAES